MVANITLAVSDDYKDKQTGQHVERTEWVRVVFFGRQAEIAGEYLGKGSKIFVSGNRRRVNGKLNAVLTDTQLKL